SPNGQNAIERHRGGIKNNIIGAAIARAAAIGVPATVAIAVIIALANVIAAVAVGVGVALLDPDLAELVVSLSAEAHIGARKNALHLIPNARVESILVRGVDFERRVASSVADRSLQHLLRIHLPGIVKNAHQDEQEERCRQRELDERDSPLLAAQSL